MKILAVGGGSGGHITPLVAVLGEIKKCKKTAQIRIWCDYKFFSQAHSIVNHFDKNIAVSRIISGKLRRYNHLSVLRQLFMPKIVFLNIRDIFLTAIGFFQSIIKLLLWRPDVIFAKGGFVCLPVGFAAHLLKIPLVIHDSDAHPGLTNRVLSRWASAIATGAPLEYYSYPSNKAIYTGIPISDDFREFSALERKEAKLRWGVSTSRPLIVVTGGGLGAQRMNDATVMVLDDLMRLGSVIIQSGSNQYDELRSITPPNGKRFQLHPFVSKDMALLLGAADVVIARAGATTILELAALVKPTILVPNRMLAGGHQLKNAAVYSEKEAVKIIDEAKMVQDPQILVTAVKEVLHNPKKSEQMAKKFSAFVRSDAASIVADMIISASK